MFAEIVYEDGARSVGSYESEEEALAAAREQHARAQGEAGGPTGHRATKVLSIHLYDTHPNDLPPPSEEVLNEQMKDLSGDAMERAAKIREMTSPLVEAPEEGESMYKMEATKVLTEGWEE